MSDTSTMVLHIPFSKDLAALLGTQSQATERARELIILGLYQESCISGGKAAERNERPRFLSPHPAWKQGM